MKCLAEDDKFSFIYSILGKLIEKKDTIINEGLNIIIAMQIGTHLRINFFKFDLGNRAKQLSKNA